VVRAKGIEIMNIINSGMANRTPLYYYIEQNKDKILKITIELDS
jgi:hypothetical protein